MITTIDPDTIEVDLEVLKRTSAELDGNDGGLLQRGRAGPVAVGDAVALETD